MNWELTSQHPLTQVVLSFGIATWNKLVAYITNLPYGRTTNREDLSLVLTEQKGTCSSKHAFLATIAQENQLNDISLLLVLFKMNGKNTPKVGPILTNYNLSYIPEAHTVLQVGDEIIDATSPNASFDTIEDSVLHTEVITPSQIIRYKVQTHQDYIKQWLEEQEGSYSFEQLWNIREECIEALSK